MPKTKNPNIKDRDKNDTFLALLLALWDDAFLGASGKSWLSISSAPQDEQNLILPSFFAPHSGQNTSATSKSTFPPARKKPRQAKRIPKRRRRFS
jgi:hypothetical protein